VTTLWVTIIAVALASATIKAAGSVLVGGRELSPRATAVIALLAPALLAALVVTETFGEDRHLVLDERWPWGWPLRPSLSRCGHLCC
jgi:uncharacterized membrane protein